ncbi:MAG: adaptor protein MecA [Clostridia bacterium]|nr:adaptor protein MecA [Clostridia bacterium]
MRIERLDENKIKVTVGGDDIKMWNVDLKNFTDNTVEAQDMFWFALKQAEQDVNFTVGQAQLLVETMPDGDEGFVLFISRIESEAALSDALIRAGKRAKQTEIKARRRGRVSTLLRIFKFRDFEDVCVGVGEIRELYMGKSRLIKYQDEFYLELIPLDSFGFFEMENILSEFAQKSKQPLTLQGVLNEHGKVLIAADAVSVISNNFI